MNLTKTKQLKLVLSPLITRICFDSEQVSEVSGLSINWIKDQSIFTTT